MDSRYFAIIPAAGSGSRFGASSPKQYLPLGGKPLLKHTLAALLSEARISHVLVVLAPDDACWHADCLPEQGADRVSVVRVGGDSRAETVLNGLRWLAAQSAVNRHDWVLVHDAARPCLTAGDLAGLMDTVADDPVGGLLAIPVADTLKRADDEKRVVATVDRQQLWQAQTPQMFRLSVLQQALETVDLARVTDEASAIEAQGLQPLLVLGSLTNLKVTYPADLVLAETIMHYAAQ